ncbi:hypothetical protein M413DRAFT_26229 [Hebeloma cylindrosporum]|uniref:Homeobox domain-containing protein n=1 Tax=Hebeloma cylindrosporum TaxID=76867 RepID=A0A0C2YPP8_HEBCY|nr:hypothetical protein M413DRAFT_26229 [Hebeloma cylindrosporum h7]
MRFSPSSRGSIDTSGALTEAPSSATRRPSRLPSSGLSVTLDLLTVHDDSERPNRDTLPLGYSKLLKSGMESSSGGKKRPIVIRANPVQTAILKAAFALSDKPSPEQIQSLSAETELPPKWINLWFGRQRSQARKAGKKVTNDDNADPDTSSSNTGFSAQEILQVKLENALDGTFLGSALSSSSSAPSTSEFVNLSEFTAVTAAPMLDSTPSAVEPVTSGKRKRQRKGKPKEKGKGKESEAPNDRKVVITRTLRSNKKNVAGTSKSEAQAQDTQAQDTSVKSEILETPFALRYTPSPAPVSASVDLGDAQVSSNHDMDADAKPCNPVNPTLGFAPPTISKAALDQILLGIAPPQRSPISATSQRWVSPNARSTLLAKQFDGIQAPTPGFRTSLTTGKLPAAQGHGFRDTVNRSSKFQRSAPYPQGPAFHTQFQNNGPWDYISLGTMIESGSNMQAGDIPMDAGFIYDTGPVFPSSVDGLAAPINIYSQSRLQVEQYYNPRLAPAFDWENHIPSSPMEFMYPPDEAFSMDNIPQTGYNEIPLVDYPLHDISMDVLNPSLAPLKHLTDVLEGFKDSNGTYAPLLNENARGKLMSCVLDETRVETNPFQAAMGLSLLSKVGHQWEY